MFEVPIFPVPEIVVRDFRTRGVYTDFYMFRQTLRLEMEQVILPRTVQAAEERVANWFNKPTFVIGTIVQKEGVRGWVIPTGPGAENWYRVSRGVKGHWITVRKPFTASRSKHYKPSLRLNRYVPKTRPGGFYGGPGIRLQPTGFRRRVWWPGIEPRNFEERIWEEQKKDIQRLLENATRRAIRASRR